MPVIQILSGLPKSGKTTFSNKLKYESWLEHQGAEDPSVFYMTFPIDGRQRRAWVFGDLLLLSLVEIRLQARALPDDACITIDSYHTRVEDWLRYVTWTLDPAVRVEVISFDLEGSYEIAKDWAALSQDKTQRGQIRQRRFIQRDIPPESALAYSFHLEWASEGVKYVHDPRHIRRVLDLAATYQPEHFPEQYVAMLRRHPELRGANVTFKNYSISAEEMQRRACEQSWLQSFPDLPVPGVSAE